jgi:uncharacterized UBP type Zn finger protein
LLLHVDRFVSLPSVRQSAAQGLVEACRVGGDTTRRQLSQHIEHYTNRAAEIQRTLRQMATPPPDPTTTAAASEPPLAAFEVDTAALSQMMDMGFTSEQTFDALRCLHNPPAFSFMLALFPATSSTGASLST